MRWPGSYTTSQSHRTDLVSSDDHRPLHVGPPRFRRNPTVLIWSVPTHPFRWPSLASLKESRNPSVLIWSVPTNHGQSEGRTRRRRNPTVLIWSAPTCTLTRPEPTGSSSTCRNPTVLIWSVPTSSGPASSLVERDRRNPTVLIWSLPTQPSRGPVGQPLWLEVAIPSYRSGQLRRSNPVAEPDTRNI